MLPMSQSFPPVRCLATIYHSVSFATLRPLDTIRLLTTHGSNRLQCISFCSSSSLPSTSLPTIGHAGALLTFNFLHTTWDSSYVLFFRAVALDFYNAL